jgi:hypothetical protein
VSLVDYEPWEHPYEDYPAPVTDPALEQRVADLEALVARLLHPVLIAEFAGELTEAEAAQFREEREKAAGQPYEIKPLPPSSLNVFRPEQVEALLREHVTLVGPGEHLVVRVPVDVSPLQVRRYQEALDGSGIPFRVVVVAGDELGVAADSRGDCGD